MCTSAVVVVLVDEDMVKDEVEQVTLQRGVRTENQRLQSFSPR